MRDLFGGETAHFAQRQRNLRVRCERRVAAGENEAQPIVLDALCVPGRGGLVGDRFDLLGDILDRVEPCAPADAVDRLEAPGRYEPRPRILRHAFARPLLERGAKRVV